MESKDLTLHGCEQVLRFSTAAHWNDLTEERKVQLGYNMGVMSHGLGLSKEDSYDAMASVREGKTSIQDLHNHVRRIAAAHHIAINEDWVAKPF